VAEKLGVGLPYSCMTGQCGACEVEIVKTDAATGEQSTSTVRACVAAFPRGYSKVRVDELGDAIWGSASP